ncbi:MAG: hypothetical protein ACREHF_13910 [Rhizomicrobium sp.]
MNSFMTITTAAAALLGSVAFMGGPANAAEWGVRVGVGPGIGFDVHSGGYCDRWGCPGHYWAYPIYYGPVFYDGTWFRGPAYTRVVNGEHWYWIHGGWHRDQWRGPRPQWARGHRYGPALGLDYYREHGFRVSDRDWHDWYNHNRSRAYHTGYTQDRNNTGYDRPRDERNWYRDQNGHAGNQNRNDYDRNAYHSGEQGPPMKAGFEQRRSLGHPLTPPIVSHRSTNSRSHPASDRSRDRQNENGPSE